MAGKQLTPGFAAPHPEGMDHHLYSVHIERSLLNESPDMFGMSSNAEIGYLTNAAEDIFSAFQRWVEVNCNKHNDMRRFLVAYLKVV